MTRFLIQILFRTGVNDCTNVNDQLTAHFIIYIIIFGMRLIQKNDSSFLSSFTLFAHICEKFVRDKDATSTLENVIKRILVIQINNFQTDKKFLITTWSLSHKHVCYYVAANNLTEHFIISLVYKYWLFTVHMNDISW